LYRTNGTSWTFDANGIVVSTDALFMGGTGSVGSSTGIWFPVAPGITTLPTTPGETNTAPTQIIGNVATVGTNAQTTLNTAFPSAVNGDGVVDLTTGDIWKKESGTWVNRGPTPGVTLTASTLVPVANERVSVEGRTRASVQVTTISYALNLPLVTLAPTVKAKVLGYRVLLVNVPTAVGVSMAGAAPSVSTGVAVQAGASGLALAALAPAVIIDVILNAPASEIAAAAIAPLVQTGSSVAVPAANIAFAALAPLSAGGAGALLLVSAVDTAFAALAPVIATGTSLSIPVVTITVTAEVPGVSATLGGDYYGDMAVQLYGWESEFFIPWWGN